LDNSFKNFEWYDIPVVLFFSNLLGNLAFATLFGGGFITGIMLVFTWEGWKLYEKFRAKSVDN